MIDIGRHRLPPRARGFNVRWLLLLAIPFVAAACVTVTDQGGALRSAAPVPTPIVDPLATPSQAPLATPTPAPTPDPTPQPVEAEVFGFLPNWLIDDAVLALDSDLLTTVAFNGVEASGDGKLVARKPGGVVPPGWKVLQSETFVDLKSKLQAEGVDVVLSVQRFGWTEGNIKRTENLLTNRKNRRQLAERIAKLVTERGLDGVNLDFEPMPTKLTDRYSAFVREVRSALDDVDEDLKLSVDVVSNLAGYDLAALTADDAADVVVIMGYNYRGDDAARAASAAPLVDAATGDLTTSVQDAIAQAPADKIILALPWYGKAWSTETDKAGSATISGRGIDGSADVPFADAVEFASQSGRRYEAGQASAWTAYPSRQCASCEAVWRQVWYEDSESFGAKIDLALEQDLAGVGIWALGHEAGRPELWSTLRDRLRPREDEAPPNGSASLDPEGILGTSAGLDVVQGSAPLRLFASDGTEGSGLAFVRIGLDAETADDGRLAMARTYPAVERIDFPLADPETGGSSETGARSIHVQWQDIAGNWSVPLVIEAWVEKPVTLPTPQDIG